MRKDVGERFGNPQISEKHEKIKIENSKWNQKWRMQQRHIWFNEKRCWWKMPTFYPDKALNEFLKLWFGLEDQWSCMPLNFKRELQRFDDLIMNVVCESNWVQSQLNDSWMKWKCKKEWAIDLDWWIIELEWLDFDWCFLWRIWPGVGWTNKKS